MHWTQKRRSYPTSQNRHETKAKSRARGSLALDHDATLCNTEHLDPVARRYTVDLSILRSVSGLSKHTLGVKNNL